jgi:hypothetical protein
MNDYELIKKALFEKIIVSGESLIKNDLIFPFFVLSAHAIETMGAVADNKPFRAREQTMERFNLALRKLYGLQYVKINQKNFFYEKFRCEMVHLLFPSKHIFLTSVKDTPENLHLTFAQEKLILVAEKMQIDNQNALRRLWEYTDKSPTLQKKIVQSWRN